MIGLRLYSTSLSFSFEEVLHQGFAFLFQYSLAHRALGVKGIGGKTFEPTLFVASTKYHSAHLRPAYGSCTHDAGFYRYIERAVLQVFAAKRVGCRSDGLHLGMGSDIA